MKYAARNYNWSMNMKDVIKILIYAVIMAALIASVYTIGKYNTIQSARLISDNSSQYVISYGNGINDDNLTYHVYNH